MNTERTPGEVPPLVSILIPCWGCRDFIEETVRSALAQSYPRIEVIVVEDRGTDGTYEAARAFRDPRLAVHRNEQNLGQYGNKNRALALARGELVKFVDGDDVLEPDAVAALVEAWQRAGPGTGVVFGQYHVIDETGRLLQQPRRWGLTGRLDGREVLAWVLTLEMPGSMFGNVSPHLFERAALERVGGFPKDNKGSGDIETFLRLLCVTDVCFTERPAARYRVHSGGMSGKTFGLREATDHAEMVDRVVAFFRTQPGVPAHLLEPRFVRAWKVWASGHQIFASLQHRLRGRPNQFEAIAAMYRDAGLAREFWRFVTLRFGAHIARTLKARVFRVVAEPALPPLFTRRFHRAHASGAARA